MMAVEHVAGLCTFAGMMTGALSVIYLWKRSDRAQAVTLRMMVHRHVNSTNNFSALCGDILQHARVLEESDAT